MRISPSPAAAALLVSLAAAAWSGCTSSAGSPGSTSGVDGGESASDAPSGSDSTPSDSGSGQETGGRARDPRCPASVPAAGAACNPQPAPLECEYRGDAFGRCTTTADCSSSTAGGPFTFQLSTATNCGPNPAECPSSFAATAATDGGACNTLGLSCTYDEGVCGCLCTGTALAWTCRARSGVASEVNVVPQPSPLPICPTQRPLVGDACSVEGQSCGYATYCEPATSLGPSILCTNGYWEIMPNNGFCATPTCHD